MMNDPYFYPMGEGGVDFPALLAFLKVSGWRDHLNVELDTSPGVRPRKAPGSPPITFATYLS